VHASLPAALNLPASHSVLALLPSHRDPAGHVAHDERVVDVSPSVAEPAGHTWQVSELAVEYLLSSPQAMHVAAPAGLYLPATHGAGVLLPSHALPFGHALQADLMSGEEPATTTVREPATHVEHDLAPALEYVLSLVQSVHVLLPAPLYFPASHNVTTVVPSHRLPAGHGAHVSR